MLLDVPVFDSLAETTFEPPTMTLPNQRFPGLQLKAPVFVKKNSGRVTIPVSAIAVPATDKTMRIAKQMTKDRSVQ